MLYYLRDAQVYRNVFPKKWIKDHVALEWRIFEKEGADDGGGRWGIHAVTDVHSVSPLVGQSFCQVSVAGRLVGDSAVTDVHSEPVKWDYPITRHQEPPNVHPPLQRNISTRTYLTSPAQMGRSNTRQRRWGAPTHQTTNHPNWRQTATLNP